MQVMVNLFLSVIEIHETISAVALLEKKHVKVTSVHLIQFDNAD